MDNLITFILGSSSGEFTPEVLIRYMAFVLILSCISSLAQSAFGIIGGRR